MVKNLEKATQTLRFFGVETVSIAHTSTAFVFEKKTTEKEKPSA